MKTNIVRHLSLGLAAGLAFLGCARPSAEAQQSKAIVSPMPAPVGVAQSATVGVNDPASESTNAPAILERIEPSVKPENVALSPGLAEVAKLAQAGVSEEVMLAYVDKYSGSFSIGADQILYLNDVGVSSTVITSMLKHDGNTGVTAEAAPSVAQTQAVPNAPPAPAYEQSEPPQVATAVAPPPTSTEVSYFYDSLSPYGSWVYLSGYGWCWQPTVAVSVPAWRPYSDRGRWYWSDSGWYWNSDYSWGWAAFHYGRWYHHASCGWVWTPGLTWAPSWVSWRYSDGYCGWAPLPPAAHYVYGSGFSYYGRHVSVGFEFGLSDFHYSFVSTRNFCDYSPARHFVPRTSVRNVYRNTTVINNYVVGNNNTVINRGVGRETVARQSATRIREVSVRETPVQSLSSVRGDRIQRQGDQTVAYRPQLPKTPPQVRTAQFVNRSGGQNSATVGRNTTSGSVAGNAQVTTTGRRQTGVNTDARVATGTTSTETRRGQSGGTVDATPAGRSTGENRRQNAQQNANEPRAQKAVPNSTPQTRASDQQQQRGNRTLFGDSGARAVPQQNNTTVARTAEPRSTPVPRAQAQPNYGVPTARAYPQATAPLRQQPPAHVEPRNQAPTTMSPRGHEQLPRANAPTYTAPAQSAPQVHSQGGGGGGGKAPVNSGGGGSHNSCKSDSGRSDSGSGRNDRPGRNH